MRVLVVEDDLPMARLLRRALVSEGYAVDVVHNGTDALWMGSEGDYDAVVMDVMIPAPSGVEVAQTLRRRGRWAPILLLTARAGVPDRVAGLDSGADDYLTKPFALDELFARLRSLTRRGLTERPTVLTCGDLALDPGSRTVERAGSGVDLTAKEFQLLSELMRHPGEVLSRTHLLEHVWDGDYDGTSNVVEVHIRRLREKVDRPFGRASIATLRGAGYRLCADQPAKGQPAKSQPASDHASAGEAVGRS